MDIASVLIDRYPGQRWNLTNNDYDTLVWESVNNVHKPTLEELETIWPTGFLILKNLMNSASSGTNFSPIVIG